MAAAPMYEDGSSTESEFYFDAEDPEAAEPSGSAEVGRAEEKAAPSAGVAAFPSSSVTDGSIGRTVGAKTATVTDSDSSIDGASAGNPLGDKESAERAAAAAKSAGAGRSESRAAPRGVSLNREDGTSPATNSSATRKLSGSLRQKPPAAVPSVDPLFEKIEQGLSNPRSGGKRSQPSSAASSPRSEGFESKRQKGDGGDVSSGSGRVARLHRAESERNPQSRSRQHSEENRSHSRDDASRSSREESRSEWSRSIRSTDRRDDELPGRNAREKSSSSLRSASAHGSYRSDHDDRASTAAASMISTSASGRRNSDWDQSDSRHGLSRRPEERTSDSSSYDYSASRDPRRSRSHHSDAKRSDSTPGSNEYSSTRNPRRSSTRHPEDWKHGEMESSARSSSSKPRDPRYGASDNSKEHAYDVRPSIDVNSTSRNPRRSVSLHPAVRDEDEKRHEARTSSSEYNITRDPRRSPSRHSERHLDQRSRDPRLRPSSQHSEHRKSPPRHHEVEIRQNPGRGADEYERKRERPEFHRSSSQHPDLRDEDSSRPPTRGSQYAAFRDNDTRPPHPREYSNAPSPRQYESRPHYEPHQLDQHKSFQSGPPRPSERFVDHRGGRELPPRQDDRYAYPPGQLAPSKSYERPDLAQYSPRDFVRRDGTLDHYFQNLHQERQQGSGYGNWDERSPPPLPPGYYLMESRTKSPRAPQNGQSPTWRDPRRDPRARAVPRQDASASAVHPEHSQPQPAKYRQEFDTQERRSGNPAAVRTDEFQRSRSVGPRREDGARPFSPRVPEKSFGTDKSYEHAATTPRRIDPSASSVPASATRDPRQLNANGKRPRPELSSTPLRAPQATESLLATGQIDHAYVQAVIRFKLTSRFAEHEMNNPSTFHKHEYLLHLQSNMGNVKKRLERQHPDAFHVVFDEANVTQEHIERFSARKAYSQRMLRFLRDQQALENYSAAVADGKPTRYLDVGMRQRTLDKQREALMEEEPFMFDRMMEQWDPKKGICVFARPFHEEWADI